MAQGDQIAFYASFTYLDGAIRSEFPEGDVWYTERNGDGIGLLVPKGTPGRDLPKRACGYWILEWIDPAKDFGTGVRVGP